MPIDTDSAGNRWTQSLGTSAGSPIITLGWQGQLSMTDEEVNAMLRLLDREARRRGYMSLADALKKVTP